MQRMNLLNSLLVIMGFITLALTQDHTYSKRRIMKEIGENNETQNFQTTSVSDLNATFFDSNSSHIKETDITTNITSNSNNNDTTNNNQAFGARRIQTEESEQKDTQMWVLIGLAVGIPIILIPMALLFTGRNNQKENNQDTEKKSEGGVEGLVSLKGNIKLSPCVAGSDTFIIEFPKAEVITKEDGLDVYFLPSHKTILCTATGDLYHPKVGLLFIYLKDYVFEPDSGLMRNIMRNEVEPARVNQVFDVDTKSIYERQIFMAYDPLKSFFYLPNLPKSIVVDEQGKNQSKAQRAALKDVPQEFQDIYKRLLEAAGERSSIIQSWTPQSASSIQSCQVPTKDMKSNQFLISPLNFSKRLSIDSKKTDRSGLVVPSILSPNIIQTVHKFTTNIDEEATTYYDAISETVH